MTVYMRIMGILPALTVIRGVSMASAALAQSATSSTASEDAGATTGLGTHHRFPSVAAAQQHCPDDTIVWSNGVNLTYHTVQSGSTSHGFYACKMEADGAGFHQAS